MQPKRSSRVGDQIKREISEIVLLILKDPKLGFITITDVELTDDLRYAKVFYSVLGDEKERKESQQGLERAKGFIQREIGKRIRLKHIPRIIFRYDHTTEMAARIEQLLKQVHTEPKVEDEGKV
ncbi:MAG: 30S ribosome-binding factor RbfA [candidate division Zixibacteria bacterium]|jgi:ribosome-binding factor A|nr:30S ribosome-binding factor RbfA [candidate division Zixibacteria bacterium]